MKRLIWSTQSLDDIADIANYITRHDPVASVLVRRAIRERARLLRSYPLAGEAIGPLRKLSLRTYPYVLIYQVDTDVEVVRVHHQSQDWRPQ